VSCHLLFQVCQTASLPTTRSSAGPGWADTKTWCASSSTTWHMKGGGGGGDINRNKRDTIKTGACKKVCSDPGWKLSFPHSCRNGLEGRKLCMQQLQRP